MEWLNQAWTYLQGHAAGGAVATGAVVFLIAAAYYAPVYMAQFMERELKKVRESGWPESAPQRLAFWIALLELVEFEVPDKGTGAALYARMGNYIALALARFIPPIAVLGPRIGTVLERCGDRLDECIHTEIARYKPAAPPPPAEPPKT